MSRIFWNWQVVKTWQSYTGMPQGRGWKPFAATQEHTGANIVLWRRRVRPDWISRIFG